MDGKICVSYNKIHQICQEAIEVIRNFHPDIIIGVGWGGFIPARIIRTLLKEYGLPTIGVAAAAVSLYETIPSEKHEEQTGVEVRRIQWLDYKQLGYDLIGRRILIVDDVDDTRTTLQYFLSELQKDLDSQLAAANAAATDASTNNNSTFGIFVVHNKVKEKRGKLPADILDDPTRYIVGRTVPDKWISYPWEVSDIVEHTRIAVQQGNDIFL